MNITIYNESYRAAALEDFMNTLMECDLCFYGSTLLKLGMKDMHEIDEAVARAMKVCKVLGMPLRGNFKMVYVYEDGDIVRDWLLSPLARKLVLMNADADNPLVAKIQVALLEHLQ